MLQRVAGEHRGQDVDHHERATGGGARASRGEELAERREPQQELEPALGVAGDVANTCEPAGPDNLCGLEREAYVFVRHHAREALRLVGAVDE